jgi:hypothetical protein
MSSRWRYLLLAGVAVAAGFAYYLYLRGKSHGVLSAEFDGWRMLSAPGRMGLIVRNGTDRPVRITDVVCSGSIYTTREPIRVTAADGEPLGSIAAGGLCEVLVDGFPPSGTAEIYFDPWSSAKAREEAARAAARPSWLARWLQPAQPTKIRVKVERLQHGRF